MIERGMETKETQYRVQMRVPRRFVDPHRAQAMSNHGQTLERLDERAGLDPMELVWVIEDRKIDWKNMPTQGEALKRLGELLIEYETERNSIG